MSILPGAVSGTRRLSGSPAGLLGALLLVFWVVVAAFAPWFAPFDPDATMTPFQKPFSRLPGAVAGGVFWPQWLYRCPSKTL